MRNFEYYLKLAATLLLVTLRHAHARLQPAGASQIVSITTERYGAINSQRRLIDSGARLQCLHYYCFSNTHFTPSTSCSLVNLYMLMLPYNKLVYCQLRLTSRLITYARPKACSL